MAYRDDIAALGAEHHWDFNGDSLDQIGSVNGNDTSINYSSVAIAEDATNCAETNSNSDRLAFPSAVSINNSNQARKSIGGWFSNTKIQTPPKRIYGEGTQEIGLQFILAYGNTCLFEVMTASLNIQVITDRPLVPNRSYHIFGMFQNASYGNEVSFFLDGVKQPLSVPANPSPGANTLTSRGVGEFGNSSTTTGVGKQTLDIGAGVNFKYQHWVNWGDIDDAQLTDQQVRELFEKGALPEVIVPSGTESVMQTFIDGEANTAGVDTPLDIRIFPVTGDGDLNLVLDNRTFNPLSSLHIQYMGAGTLTIINKNGANASIGSAPNGGTVVFSTEVAIRVVCRDATTGEVIESARVYLLDSNDRVILNSTTNISGEVEGVYNYITDNVLSPKSRARKGSSSPYYKTAPIAGTITEEGLDLTILMLRDE